jgi:hypothetical protein
MVRMLLLTIYFLSYSLCSCAQRHDRSYNCYELKKRSVQLYFSAPRGGKFADSNQYVAIADCLNKKHLRNVLLNIRFGQMHYLNTKKNSARPVDGDHLGNQFHNDVIDSISLEIYYKDERIGYRHIPAGLTVETFAKLPFRPLGEIKELKEGYNARDTLYRDQFMATNGLAFELNDLVLPEEKDLSAKFTMWFNDGKVIRKKL